MALACDLGLDSILHSADVHKWVWFRRYCLASRVASALENRGMLPIAFCEEVNKKVQEISLDCERLDRDYENQSLFSRDQDEQLLHWLNRSVYLSFHLFLIYYRSFSHLFNYQVTCVDVFIVLSFLLFILVFFGYE